ncbi:uncharacterized protein EDB91DRAFT_1044528 [Suillus paluster]|uniref:uncharacterized protein n=1 Tax=Suillus paluster TaxID=48578 RepID=UPI001B88397E|nr:uncharacterized protein EDB91DRAFT_1044528 [Suillus paluster]KAG1752504.1 hypothetical protein EDB91DRAFT_1044528 [Suillus paluster]
MDNSIHVQLYICSCTNNRPNDDTGMWIVQPEFNIDGSHKATVIHFDTIVHAAHLIAIYGRDFLPKHLSPAQSLDIFQAYCVNKYIDHHSVRIVLTVGLYHQLFPC